MNMKIRRVRILFEPRDLWIGIYWRLTREFAGMRSLHIYICLVPMLPLHLLLQIGTMELKYYD